MKDSKIYPFRWSLLLVGLTLMLTACGGGKKQEKPAVTAEQEKKLEFALPEVPLMLQAPEERLRYVVQHYWENFDFTDTAYVHAPDITEQAMANYIDLLSRMEMEEADSCLTQTMQSAAINARMLEYFSETLRRYLFDPNSPMRQEDLYAPVARWIAAFPASDEAARSRANHDLKLISMNRPGTVAADFVYTLPSGEQRRMHALSSPYTLLLFYNPDCHGCAETLEALRSSEVLNRPEVQKQMKILAFYPDEELEVWENHRSEIPDTWVNSYDKTLTVLTRELYDLKAMPTLYLLDRDKKVLLKDVSVGAVEYFFENNPL